MKKFPVRAFLLLSGIALCASPFANAVSVAVPEIDPGAAVGAITLLAGSLVVIRARFRK